MAEENRRKLKDRLRDRYRFVILNDKTLHTVRQGRYSVRRVLSVISVFVIVVVAITGSAISFTSIRTLIPGYPSDKMRDGIIQNAIRLDSLEYEIALRDRYVNDFRRVLAGEEPLSAHEALIDSVVRPDQIKFKKFNHDSVFKDRLAEEKFNMSLSKIDHNAPIELSGMLLFAPIKGMVTDRFDKAEMHFGIDIAVKEGTKVSSTLDGTVILSEYSVQTGYVMQIQHTNNVISTYKHNKELLKKAGAKVKAGEVIAIAGNSGELTTGPHLHFELWYKGEPVNPELYIHF